jgi:hypothetical protein
MVSESMGPQRILILYWWHDQYHAMRPAIRQHLHVLDFSLNRHHVLYHNVAYGPASYLRRIRFDVVILHTTFLCYRSSPAFSRIRRGLAWLRSCNSLKIAMPQDEYDHSEVLDDWLAELGVSVICSNFDENVRPLLYPKMQRRARFLKCLTGYIDETNAAECNGWLRPIAVRPHDIVYRAAHLPYWFGSHGQLKHEIASDVAQRARELGLICDISTRPEDVITGGQWYAFLSSSKTIIGCESGSSVLDRRGQIQAQIRAILTRRPALSFSDVSKLLPPGWDDYQFFALGPRHLEAVVTRTCQVLVKGEYDGVLQPFRHYLPIRRDLGNLDEVLHMIKDQALLEATAARAYEEIYETKRYTYGGFAKALDAEFAALPKGCPILPWSCVEWWHRGCVIPGRVYRHLISLAKWLIARWCPGRGIHEFLRRLRSG